MFGGFLRPKFDANKTKVNLKMLINRLNLLTQKKANLAKQQKREIALLLRDNKETRARILVEHIIREDYTLESYDLLRQYTELLLARLNVVIQEPQLKPEVAEAVCALLCAGWLMGSEVPELHTLHQLFTAKYGKAYSEEVINNKEKYLSHRLLRMLTSTQVPDPTVVELYLSEIAKAYNVAWAPKPQARPSRGIVPVDTTGDGRVDSIAMDTTGDGRPDTVVPTVQNPAPAPLHPQGRRYRTRQTNEETSIVELVRTPLGLGLSLDSQNVVTAIDADSQARRSGIGLHDRLVSINGQPLSSSSPLEALLAAVPVGGRMSVEIARQVNVKARKVC